MDIFYWSHNLNFHWRITLTKNLQTNRKILKMFSKLVTKSKIPKPLSIQLRSLQYKPRYSHPGFLESITGSMEDPRQKLELKPTEWRDGSLRQFTDHFPIMFLIIVCGAPIVLCFFSLFWYSITDSAVT